MISLLYITLLAGLIPVTALVLLRNKTSRIGPIKPFLYLTAVSSLYEIIFSLILRKDVTIWFTIYDTLEFLLIFYFFFKLNFPKYKIFFLVSIILFVILIIPNIFFISESIHHFLNVQAIFSGAITFFIFVMTFLWFKGIFKKMEIPSLWNNPDFYYISALFIYHATTFFLFLLSDVILKIDAEKFMDYWLLNIIATLILRILLIIGVWKTPRR
jgi:hypothetical protein